MTTLLEQFTTGVGMDDFTWPYVIAGGALRDSWFDKEVVDVDVFIAVYEDMLEAIKKNGGMALMKLDPGGGLYSIDTDPNGAEDDLRFYVDGSDLYDFDTFVSVRSSHHPGLNIILRKIDDSAAGGMESETNSLVETLFSEFPCSISKLAYDPRADKWWVDEEFKETLATGEIRFSSNVTDKYKAKIFPKYADMFVYSKKKASFLKFGSGILRTSGIIKLEAY